ncbi:MAG: hypothetical protein ACI304_02360, partial [Lepagella sp.]
AKVETGSKYRKALFGTFTEGGCAELYQGNQGHQWFNKKVGYSSIDDSVFCLLISQGVASLALG